MKDKNTNPKVDEFISKAKNWKNEFEILRGIILSCDLLEELKWGKPCYTYENNNVVLIHGFKEYCALLFIKGALLNDFHKILIKQTENVQGGRQIRFTNIEEIFNMETIIIEYISEAIEIEKSGLKVNFKKNSEFIIPEELQKKFHEMPAIKDAFDSLTPGRQKGYIIYFSEAKQSKTRQLRIEKSIERILLGKGLND